MDYDSVLKDFEDLLNPYDEEDTYDHVYHYDYKNAEGENYATDYDLGFPKLAKNETGPKWFTELHDNTTNNKNNETNHTKQTNNRKTKNVNDISNNSYGNNISYLYLCLCILLLTFYDKFSNFM